MAHHVISARQFRALSAGEGDRDVVGLLWRTQLSRRLLQITAVFAEAERKPDIRGPLPPAAAAWTVLASARSVAPARIDEILLHTQVGSWAAYVLRRHRGGAGSTATPIWVDFGGLHALALVAAARAGLRWTTRLPARDGRVMLPSLGMATFATSTGDAVVDAETADGEIRLRYNGCTVAVPQDGAESGGWWNLRRLRSGTDPRLTVWLDDLDPFRDLADPVPPARLNDSAVATWRSLLDGAWNLLCRDHPESAEAIAAGVVSLVPLPVGDGWETRSASSGEAFGAVLVSPPPDATTLAVALVHEFQHIKLGGLMHLLRLAVDDDTPRFYAPWRDDPRPIGGLLQGVYAFVGIAGFWRRHRGSVSGVEAKLATFEYAYARIQSVEALRIVRGSGLLTAWGTEFVQGLSDSVDSWLVDLVEPDLLAAARLVADHHRAGWRIRHHRVAPETVGLLTTAWHDGRPAEIESGPPGVAPAPATRWSLGMLGLVRRRIIAPGNWRDLGSSSDAPWLADISDADLDLVAGDSGAAGAEYLKLIEKNVRDPDAWSGLGSALSIHGRREAAAAISERPELVLGVYEALAGSGPDPVALAEWLGQSLMRPVAEPTSA